MTGTPVCLQARSFSVRPMSALGHKQTYAVQNGLSALLLKADICGAKRDVR